MSLEYPAHASHTRVIKGELSPPDDSSFVEDGPQSFTAARLITNDEDLGYIRVGGEMAIMPWEGASMLRG